MKIFLVFKARTLLFGLLAIFAVVLVLYTLNQAAGPVFARKQKNITFLGHNVDPKAPDLEKQIEGLTKDLVREPVAAQYDSINKAVVPELNGFEIDLPATIDKITAAKNGGNVEPVWSEKVPEKSIKDFMTLPIYQGNPVRNQVALVINVSWGNEYLEQMLAILKEENVKATFFLVGRWAEENHEMVKKIHDLGMDFGNHGYSDPHMQDLGSDEIKAEIVKTNNVIKELTGVETCWFSPPYGEKVEKIYAAAAELKLHTVLWSLDTIDWKLPGEQVIISRILDNLHNGAVVLMHPTEQTPGALRAIIAGVRQNGLDLVTISELLNPCYWSQKYAPLWTGP